MQLMGFLLTTRAGRLIDLEALWDTLSETPTAVTDALPAAVQVSEVERIAVACGVLLGIRLALDEPLLARCLSVDFEGRAGRALGVPAEAVEITTRELVAHFLAAAEVHA
jgi:hypothetical protein